MHLDDALRRAQRAAAHGNGVLKLDKILPVLGDVLAERLRSLLLHVRVGISPLRQHHGVDDESVAQHLAQIGVVHAPVLEHHVDAPDSGVRACRIAVVEHDDALGVAAQQLDLLGCQRRPTRGDGVRHARLMQRDHVGIPLDQQRFAGRPNLLSPLVQPVEHFALR